MLREQKQVSVDSNLLPLVPRGVHAGLASCDALHRSSACLASILGPALLLVSCHLSRWSLSAGFCSISPPALLWNFPGKSHTSPHIPQTQGCSSSSPSGPRLHSCLAGRRNTLFLSPIYGSALHAACFPQNGPLDQSCSFPNSRYLLYFLEMDDGLVLDN